MTRGELAQVIDAGGYTEHVRERLAGVTVAVVEVDTSHVVAGLERLVAAGDLRAVLCHADGQGPCVASCCPIKGQRAPAVCRPVHQHPPSTPETTGTAPQGDRAAGGDCLIPRGGERPSHGGGKITGLVVNMTSPPPAPQVVVALCPSCRRGGGSAAMMRA